MKKLFTLTFCLIAATLQAQDGSTPGRSQVANIGSVSQQIGGGAQPLFRPDLTPITQTGAAIAEAYTPDIQTLATNLGSDPTRIFNYVHDQIRYVHYFGSKKGAELTLLERSGNDFDQCALLSALLQAAGYAPHYQFGWMIMPYDNTTNQHDLHHWLGLSLQNTNWTTTIRYLTNFFAGRGFYNSATFNNDTNDFLFQRLWVTLPIGGTTYYLDPSFKVTQPIGGTNLVSAMGFNTNTLTNTLWTSAAGTDSGSYVTNLNEASLRGTLQTCNSNLLGYLSNNAPDATLAQIIGGEQISSSTGLPLRTSNEFSAYTNTSYGIITVNWTNQPTNFMGTFSISFAGTNKTWLTPQLQGQRISLTFSNNGVAQLWLEDSQVLQVNNTSPSNTVNVILSATHPYGGWNTSLNIPTDSGELDGSSTNAYQTTNASYAIMYAFEANQQWLKERQLKLNAYLAAGYTNGSRQITTETLNVMGLGWLVQTELVEELLSQEWGQLAQNHHRFGRMGQEAGRGYYVDVYLQLDGTFPSTGNNPPDMVANNEVFDVSSYFWSAMEHGIIEQLQNSNLVAASTVKMIEIANTNSQAVYLANSGNWSTVRNSLVGYGSTTNTLNSLISQGFTLLLPQNGSNHVTGTTGWAGDGYVELGIGANQSRSMGMIISGAYNGGYVNNSGATVNTPFVQQSGENQPAFFNPASATLPTGSVVGADPVNLVDGTFQITSTDLSLGQTEPRGLNLTRYYSSERINYNPAGMAPGWLHSYYCNAMPVSDPESGLGTATVQQMSPMIVATCAALNLYNDVTPDPKNWTVTALIAKWGIDQLINNAVSINLGNSTIQFARQPDGSYTPPGNCTMSLTQSGGAFVVQERHGRTFKFNTNTVLTNIVDQYGQSMKLAYNSNNLVTNVTDWANRSLTFNYAGIVLTNVSDSTGRSVSYGYSGGELTSYTDPEHKTTTYAYDANTELIATFDALGNLVESNYYDGLGHIMTQLTQGNTNKTWQVCASGYQTVEFDPAGDELVYTYDSKSRLISFQDGMGNVTQTVYDGQDHVIETISPLNEVNQFFYDGNNNVIETIDPLGYSNVFTFDTNNNLIASTDGRGKTSHFGYNSQFSLVGLTNGNGDWTAFSYNPNGTLASRQDSGGTTTYGYDSYGAVNNITYPSSLGSESFINSTLGDPTGHTDVRSFTTTFGYNNRRQLTNTVAPTNLTAKASFDANANLSTTTDARGFVSSNSWSTTRKLLSTTLPPVPQGTPVVTSTYDNRDWLASTQNPLGNVTYYTNDAAQRLIATTDPLQRPTFFGYDNDSHQISSTDAAGDQTTQFWNARGNLIKVIDAATNIVGKTYDGAGNLIYLTNRNGKVWTFQYDGANRLTNTISPLGHSSSQVYNNRGLLQSGTDALNQTTTYGYDARGRMSTKTDNVGVNNYQYDGNNNLTQLTNAYGPALSWTYDAYNRVVGFTNAAGYVIQYRYDQNGNLTNLVYPGNLTVKYYYDSNNRLTNVTDWTGRQTVIGYDLAGHATSVTRPNNTVRVMSYDNDGELTNIVEQTTTKFPICFYTLNYSLAGRVQWEFKGPLPHSNAPPSRTMAYDDDNRLTTFNSTSVSVDNDGRLTYGPGTNNTFGTYIYDARNELIGAGGLGYGYDPAGNRTSLTNGSAVSTFVLNPQGSQVLMRITGTVTNYYIYGGGLLYEIDQTASGMALAYYHFDCRGGTVALTDNNGNPTDLIEYSSYGTTTYRYGTNTTPFLYNGQFGVQTDANGLLYLRARYYNPYICRFLNADPSGFAGGLNMYAFADGNPISNVDPFGLQSGPGLMFYFCPHTVVYSQYGPNAGGAQESQAAYQARFNANVIQPLQTVEYAEAGAAVGIASAGTVSLGAMALVSAGVPQSVVTGGLFVTGVAGIAGSGYSIYNNPSPNNIAFNAGGLAGGLIGGGMAGEAVNSALSPPGYQPSGPASLASELSMVWRDNSGNPNPLSMLPAWLLPGAEVGPMSTGPSTGGAAGAIGGAGAGTAAAVDWLGNPVSSSSSGKH
jgi:RHS repeat-associated protein